MTLSDISSQGSGDSVERETDFLENDDMEHTKKRRTSKHRMPNSPMNSLQAVETIIGLHKAGPDAIPGLRVEEDASPHP